MAKAKQSKKQRKWGRNALTCAAYAASHRREHNKVRRLKKHIKRFPADAAAAGAIETCVKAIRGY